MRLDVPAAALPAGLVNDSVVTHPSRTVIFAGQQEPLLITDASAGYEHYRRPGW
ncbi:MAG: hypothetical protein HUU14_12400 [Dehalococcoidia bacterium]|nr:hypothetical protein [Dehalococcoidia bacterium]NUQ56681.1 hypothetical protein [Dehalococcoidia bacterium]